MANHHQQPPLQPESRLHVHSLYVGDLHPSVTEGQLMETFSEISGFVSATLCRDAFSGLSRCFGYLNFTTLEQAKYTIETKNHTMINGKSIRLMMSQRDSEARNTGTGNVFVKNLDSSIDSMKLESVFSTFGTILSCKVETTEDGESKGYGFVQFESDESAQNAIQEVNGKTIEGKEIYVGRFIKKRERVQGSTKYTNLYVKNFDHTFTEDTLQDLFSTFGNITSLVIAKDSNGVSKGFGFVSFENPEEAKQAKETLDGKNLGSKILYVARAQKKKERKQILELEFEERRKEKLQQYKKLNVYIKNINDDVDDSQLKEYFGQCGSIVSAKIMQTEKGINRGFGFVSFSAPHEAERAINTLNGVFFHGKPLYVAFAQTKEERKMSLLQRMQRNAFVATSAPPKFPIHTYIGQPPMYQSLGFVPHWRPHAPPAPAPLFLPNIPSFSRGYWRNNNFVPKFLPPFANPGYHQQRQGRFF